ncbi:MAG: hypothetical protein ABF990_00390 [Acetobacter sp.]
MFRFQPGALVLLALVGGIAACADDPHQQYYHPHAHRGRTAPSWYSPPTTPEQGNHPYSRRNTGAVNGVNYGGAGNNAGY